MTFSIPLLAFGLVLLGFGGWQLWRELAPYRWPQENGVILASRVVQQQTGEGGLQFIPVIEYEFQHRGQSFRSSRRRPGNYVSGRRKKAESVCAEYPVGSAVRVRVYEHDPRQSVLEFGATPLSWLCLAVGGLFFIVGLLPLAFP
jgi:hypothetical protein